MRNEGKAFIQFLPSLLLVGGNQEERKQKVEEILGKSLLEAKKDADFLWLFSPTNLGIEEIRNLQSFLQLKPFAAKEKKVLIEEAQTLTQEAQNALLKTLEEPPPHSLIILTAPDAQLLLPTIVSRCEVIQLSTKPQIEVNKEEYPKLVNLFKKILFSSTGKRVLLAEEEGITQDKQLATAWLDKMTFIVRQLIFAQLNLVKTESFGTITQLLECLKLINQTKKYLEANCNLRLTMEVFVTQLPYLSPTS